MKYRIVQLMNGNFEIQSKRNFFSDWIMYSYYYTDIKDAEKDLERIIINRKKGNEHIKGLEKKAIIKTVTID